MKKEDSLEKNNESKDNKFGEIPPLKTERKVKNYIPTEMPMKPDWFDDLKIKKDASKAPRPTSIIDGVLYTSKALIEADAKNQKLGTFNLIKQEVFENQAIKDKKPNTTEDADLPPTRSFFTQDSYE